MRRIFIGLFIGLFMISCSNNKESEGDLLPGLKLLSDFPQLSQPFFYADTNLIKNPPDSLRIDTALLFQVIPDSVITKDFGKSKYRAYAVGKIENESLKYYVISVIAGNKRAAYLFNLDPLNNYKSAITLVSSGFRNSTSAYGKIDNKFLVTTYRERKQTDLLNFKRNVYVADASTDEFILILTEPADDLGILNPIDSLPATHPLAGDYIKDDKNFITVRDAAKSGELLFFIHFEENKGECVGEIKGSAKITGENTAEYFQPGNPCRISFRFSNNKVEINELDGCGSFRDIYCFFEGSFPLKLTPNSAK